jgi:hypothetical protein
VSRPSASSTSEKGRPSDDAGLGEASEQLAHQPGLADPGLTADQRNGWSVVLIGEAGEVVEAVELFGAPHHDRTEARTADEHR